MAAKPDLNTPRFQGRRGAYEVWYVTVNHPDRELGAWIRYTSFSPAAGVEGEPYAALWAVAFRRRDARTVGGRQKFPLDAFNARESPFRVRIGDAELTETGCRGRVRTATAGLEWDLRWRSAPDPVQFVPGLVRLLSPVFQAGSKPALVIDGSMTVDGETLELSGARGSQQHTGGTAHALEWNWGHCAGLAGSPGSWFGGVTARVRRRGPLELGGSLVGMETAHGRALFNSSANLLVRRKQMSVQQWRPVARSRDLVLRASLTPRAQDLVGVVYDDPQGGRRYCYHSGLADIDIRLERRARAGSDLVFSAREAGTAAFEYGSAKAIAGIPLLA